MMAPRSAKAEKDGAKPGAGSPTAQERQGYNANAKAAERESIEFPIGEKTFKRRRKNWQVTRDLRGLLRKQERAQLGIRRVNKQLEELPIDADEEQVADLEDHVDELQDEGDVAAYEIIALLLRDDEGNSPDVEMMQQELDVEDVGAMAQRFSVGGEEPDPDSPTPTASS